MLSLHNPASNEVEQNVSIAVLKTHYNDEDDHMKYASISPNKHMMLRCTALVTLDDLQ